MFPGPSQSQGLLSSATITRPQGFQEDDGLQYVQHDSKDAKETHDPASEGLQSVDHDGRNAPEALSSPQLPPNVSYGHYNNGSTEKTGTFESSDHVTSSQRPRRRKWLWVGIVAVVLAIAIAVGVGAGVSLGRKSDRDGDSAGASSAASSASTTTTPTASSTSSAPVTSGTIGLAQFICNNGTFEISLKGYAYVQDCGVYYRTNENMKAPNPDKWVQNLPLIDHKTSGEPVTKYSFKECIDYCDEYNANHNSSDPECYAVSYYANLTSVFSHWPGNCFLKSGRGVGNSVDIDIEHTMSAYKNCLNDKYCL